MTRTIEIRIPTRREMAQSNDSKDTYRQGLGLSLYIAKEIVTAHSDTITVSSTPSQGMTFTAHLPPLAENLTRRKA